MDSEEVKQVVLMTINELKCQGMLKNQYSLILKDVEPVLKDYFCKKNNKNIEYFLHTHSDDPYIDILYLHYRDGVTIERMADILDKDVSTIKRNKKRLIMCINDVLGV